MIIKSISMQNFKCFTDKTVEFNERTNLIQGDYGTGKTTIYDAFKYVLDFKVDYKPKNTNEELKTSVTLVTDEHIFTKLNSSSPSYEVDGLSIKTAKEYHEKIANCFGINYAILPLLLNIRYFNEELDKHERYAILDSIFNISNTLDKIKAKFVNIKPYFDKGFDENNIKDLINQQNADITKKLESNKTLLDDRIKKLNNMAKNDYSAIKKEREDLMAESKAINSQLQQLETLKKEFESYKQKSIELIKQTNASKICPYCKQPLPTEYVNTVKQKAIKELGAVEEHIVNLINNIDNLEAKRPNLESRLQLVLKRIQETDYVLVEEINRSFLVKDIDNLQKEIRNLSVDNKANIVAVDELFKYKVEKAKTMDEIINKNFGDGITFTFTQELSSKSQRGVKLVCDCCLNGINYSNLSTGQKIYANITINNILQKHYNTCLPIWVDDYQCYGEDFNTDKQTILIKTNNNYTNFDNIVNL